MTSTAARDPHPPTAELATAGADRLAADLAAGRTTSVALTQALLDRIAAVDDAGPELRAVLAVSADALAHAAELDAERAAGLLRGPLHGIPALIKDNIEAVGLPATAGSLALAGRPVVRDAPLVASMRAAGVVVLGATNLSEWANMRSPHSTSGWSGVGGLTGNPWALDRSAGGSSAGSGAAVAAGLAPFAVGTETDGSITCPSSLNGVVGLKPTVGLVSTEGVVPLSASQDAPGPMARSVRDAALLLDAMTGSTSYAAAVGTRALSDLRFGVAEGWRTGHDGTDALFTEVLGRLEAAGSTIAPVTVEPIGAAGQQELTVLLCELKDGLDRYLADRPGAGVRSLADVVDFDERHADVELAHFGHEFLERPSRPVAWTTRSTPRRGPPASPGRSTPCSSPRSRATPVPTCSWRRRTPRPGRATWPGATTSSVAASPAPRRRSPAGPSSRCPWGSCDGLPVGLVLVGRPHSEALLLAAGHAVERALGVAGTLVPTWTPAGRG